LFAGKAKNADLAIAKTPIFKVVGEQKDSRNWQVISRQTLSAIFNFWIVKLKFNLSVVISLSIVGDFQQQTEAPRLRNIATAYCNCLLSFVVKNSFGFTKQHNLYKGTF